MIRTVQRWSWNDFMVCLYGSQHTLISRLNVHKVLPWWKHIFHIGYWGEKFLRMLVSITKVMSRVHRHFSIIKTSGLTCTYWSYCGLTRGRSKPPHCMFKQNRLCQWCIGYGCIIVCMWFIHVICNNAYICVWSRYSLEKKDPIDDNFCAVNGNTTDVIRTLLTRLILHKARNKNMYKLNYFCSWYLRVRVYHVNIKNSDKPG